MKKILIILFYPLALFSQNKQDASLLSEHRGFVMFSPKYFKYSSVDKGYFAGEFSLGFKGGQPVGIGIGTMITSFDDKLYIPVYGQMLICQERRIVRPFMDLKCGYGIYSHSQGSLKDAGGLYYNLCGGFFFPIGTGDIFIEGGYINSKFNLSVRSPYSGGYITNGSSSGGFSINIGIRP